MRISTDTAQLDLPPGESAELGVDVTNTTDLIEGVSARLIGLPAGHVTTHPTVLPLFPDSSGRLVLTLKLPTDFPAGRHPLSVEVSSRSVNGDPAYSDVDLVVPSRPALQLTATPKLIRSRRSARFVVALSNTGNVALEVALSATDPERALAIQCHPAILSVAAGATVEPIVAVRSRRMMLGSELDRAITVVATGRPTVTDTWAPVIDPDKPAELTPREPTIAPSIVAEPTTPTAEADGAGPPPQTQATAVLTYRHRPWLTRGLLTALILLLIIAIWAMVFLLGINQVFKGDPLTKTTTASFFAGIAAPAPAGSGTATGAVATGAAATVIAPAGIAPAGAAGAPGGAPAGPAPAGALPKTGTLAAGLGGSVAGTVTAASNGGPVGRILIEAQRQNREGTWVAVSSAASQADGSFEVAGLFPGSYILALSATGYTPSFAPNVTAPAAATPVTVRAGQVTSGVNPVVTGIKASITGKIDPGATTTPVVATVTVRPISGAGPGEPVATAQTDAAGTFTIPDLLAPFTYELAFAAPGYQVSTVRTTVEGGTQRFEPTVLLGTDTGSVTGLVTDGTTPLGGVAVTTTVAGKEVKTGTPTTGTIGSFVLSTLPTPATYVITFTADGFAPRTVVVDLGPGQNLTTENVALVGGSGTVTGHLLDSAGRGLGGAVVTVGGTTNPPTTTTVTDGDVGSFSLAGLPSPGSYTITFKLAGYADQTVPVTLSATAPTAPLQVTMAGSLGRLSGQVLTANGSAALGISVTATDGKRVWPGTTTAASGGLPDGSYVIAQLPAGAYTVTATALGGGTVTALVVLGPGAVQAQDFRLPGSG